MTFDEVINRCVVGEGCISWSGATDGRGYPHFSHQGRTLRVFRVLYERFIGPIPDGFQLHHECGNKACVNPAHCRPVTRRQHYVVEHDAMLKAQKVQASNKAARTHCNHGHEFTPQNTYVSPDGYRQCRICRTEADRKRRYSHGGYRYHL